MERSVEVLAVIFFGVIGLSHLLQPEAWVEYFVLLRSKGNPGAFMDGFLHLPLAGAIIGFHDVWSGIPVLLTLVGWGLLVKSLLRFCLPKHGLRMMAHASLDRLWELRLAGVALVGFAAVLGYGVYCG
jgi:hypothetical protein